MIQNIYLMFHYLNHYFKLSTAHIQGYTLLFCFVFLGNIFLVSKNLPNNVHYTLKDLNWSPDSIGLNRNVKILSCSILTVFVNKHFDDYGLIFFCRTVYLLRIFFDSMIFFSVYYKLNYPIP